MSNESQKRKKVIVVCIVTVYNKSERIIKKVYYEREKEKEVSYFINVINACIYECWLCRL